MWIFSVHGFFSVSVSKPGNYIVRARVRNHLLNLKSRFDIRGEVIELANRDYAYRIVVPKALWLSVMHELVAEQTWSNFKSEAALRNNSIVEGRAYIKALHDVWADMLPLQYRIHKRSEYSRFGARFPRNDFENTEPWPSGDSNGRLFDYHPKAAK